MNKRKLYYLLISLLLPVLGLAQDVKRDWTVNFGVGYGTYYGDLSHYRISSLSDWSKARYFLNSNPNYIKLPSLHLSAEKMVSERSGILFAGNLTNITMSDRYVNKDGVAQTSNANYGRALNFRSEIYDLGIAYKLRSSSNAFISTAIWLGGGVSYFRTFGDLYDGSGNRYDYSSAGVSPDGRYETNLREQLTETDTKYRNIVPFANLGLGINFRVSNAVSIGVESDIKYSFSDYIDDVSGRYKSSYPTAEQAYIAHPGTNIINPVSRIRGDNDGVNDFYIQNRVVVRYHFASRKSRKNRKEAFRAPAIYPAYYDEIETTRGNADTMKVKADTSSIRSVARQESIVVADSLSGISSSVVVREVKLKQIDSGLRTPDTSINDKEDRDLVKKIDSLETRIRRLEQRPITDRYQQQVDSLNNRIRILNQKVKPTATDNLQRQIYRLQRDSIVSEADKRGYQLSKRTIEKTAAPTPLMNARVPDTTVLQPATSRSNNDPVVVGRLNIEPLEYEVQNRQKQIDSLKRISERIQPREAQMQDTSLLRLQHRIDSLEKILRDTGRSSRIETIQSAPLVIRDTIAEAKLVQLDTKIEEVLARHDSAYADPAVLELMHETNRTAIVNDSAKIEALRQQVSRNEREISRYQEDLRWYNRPFKRKESNEIENLTSSNNRLQYQVETRQSELNRLRERNNELAQQLNARQSVPAANVSNRAYEKELLELTSEIQSIRRQMDSRNNYQPQYLAPVSMEQRFQQTALESEIFALREEMSRNRAQQQTDDNLLREQLALSSMNDSLRAINTLIDSLTNEITRLKNQPRQESIAPPVIAKPRQITTIPVSIYFNIGAGTATADQSKRIQLLAPLLDTLESKTVILKAFTDATGNQLVNEKLATKRAEFVRQKMMDKYSLSEEDFNIEIHLSEKSGSKPNPLDRRVDIILTNKTNEEIAIQ